MLGVFRQVDARNHAASRIDAGAGTTRIRHLQRETYIAVLAALSIVLHLLLRFGFSAPYWAGDVPLIVAVAVGGVPLIIALARHMIAGEFGADLLAGISIITAVLMSQYLVGAIIVLML